MAHTGHRPDEKMVICKACFVPRCGHTTEEDPCVMPRHHEGPHILESEIEKAKGMVNK